FSPEDEMVPARILTDFAKEHEKPRIKAAVLDGRLLDDRAIAKLAKLPSREVLLAQLLASVVAPMTQFLAAVDATLRLPAVMAMPMGGMGGGAAAAVAEEKTEFDVVLTGVGDKKIQVIKVVREITGLGLKEAKDLVDGAPKTIKEKIGKNEAAEMKAKLEE